MKRSALVLALLATLPVTAAHAGTPGWGKRSQIGQLARVLDARDHGGARKTGFVQRQPLLQKLAAFLRPGLSVKDDVRRIDAFVARAEVGFGMPVSTLQHPALDGRRMRAEKALALLEYGRQPDEVTEEIVRTTAQVSGAAIAPRDLFLQRWRPRGAASGKLYVIAPGFLETGRFYYEQAQLLNAQGHEVVILDQQWAGYTADAARGKVVKGGIDRGFGIARDTAEAAAYGQAILDREYAAHPGKQLVLVGTSMGGGPGVLGALTLYDAGKLQLGAGRSISPDRGYILQGAFLGRTRSVINDSLDFAGRVPGVRTLPLPAMGVPLLNDDPLTNTKIAAHAVAEDIRGRAQAFRAPLPDIATIRSMITERAPRGKGYAIHAAGDHLANTAALSDTIRAMQRTGAPVALEIIPGKNHVIAETAGEQRKVLEAARSVSH